MCKTSGVTNERLGTDNIDRIVSEIALILGMRDRMIPTENDGKKTKPHDALDCHACQAGVCVMQLSGSLDALTM